MCAGCGGSHEFVSYDAAVKHITDAFCSECGYVFGRADAWDEMAFLRTVPGQEPTGVRTKGAAVISDRVAREAVALLVARETHRPLEAVLRFGGTASDAAQHALALLPSAPPPPTDRGVHTSQRPAEPQLPAPRASPPRAPELTQQARSVEFMRDFAERHGRA